MYVEIKSIDGIRSLHLEAEDDFERFVVDEFLVKLGKGEAMELLPLVGRQGLVVQPRAIVLGEADRYRLQQHGAAHLSES